MYEKPIINKTIKKLEEETKTEITTMDYEQAYYELQHNYNELASENGKLKEALLKIALKL